MSYFLPHLPSGWHVDEAIKSEEDRVVIIRFGHDWDPQCMKMDETLYAISEKVQNFAVIYLCDITKVPDFNKVSLSPIPLNRCKASLSRCTSYMTLAPSCFSIGQP
jgi:thiol-disulfide isomerase/thioredoxin